MIALAIVLGIAGIAVPANAEAHGPRPCPPQLTDLELPAGKVHSGGEATGTVRLKCAWRRPVEVTLASADPSWVSVPAAVVVPAGESAADFPIQTHQPDYIRGDLSVSITARVRHQETSRPLVLQPGLKYLVADSSVISGDSVSLQIGLNGTAPTGGMTVSLESDNAALQVPESITIPSGALGVAGTYGKTVRIPQDADVTLTATLPGQTKTAVVALQAWTYDPGDWSLTGSGTMYGGTSYPMTLDLPNPVPHGGVEVTFTSDNPDVEPPSPITLAEGTSGARTVRLGAGTDDAGQTTITATMEGVGSRSHTVLIRPGLREIDMPMVLFGGQTFEGTVHLGAVTSEPVIVALSSDNPVLGLPAEVVVPAGASSVAFTGTTGAVTDFESARVTAQMGTSQLSRNVYIDPAP
ncbi:hypothetical protein [Actinomadura sp. 7K507]|uniref:hypothetical protein n=1 Tax=Actinomadura sp. 7K507 TaxID=2530365 RepID=UPI00104CB252|nr:hypothetical protein [Actinomadura sp. 7K507]TDC85262.1 hypothetical protein E1285_25435 [Actinomadura sp. 7K507]